MKGPRTTAKSTIMKLGRKPGKRPQRHWTVFSKCRQLTLFRASVGPKSNNPLAAGRRRELVATSATAALARKHDKRWCHDTCSLRPAQNGSYR